MQELLENYDELISIIVPVYNAQNYLDRCLESLIKQSYSNIEIILVDDGSTDNSARICDDYSKKDNRIKVFHIKNGGVSNARNYALQQISGQWFCFVDSDDWVDLHFVEVLYKNAVKNNCVISACSYKMDNGEGNKEKSKNEKKLLVLNSSEECICNFINSGLSLNGMVWNKLYHAELFKGIRFDAAIKINEDCLYTFDVMKKCSKACVTSEKLYHWFFREDSACHKRPDKLDFSAADVFLILLDYTEEIGNEEISVSLKKNYVSSVINTLFFVKFDRKSPEVAIILKRIKRWRKNVWKNLHFKDKFKFFMVGYCSSILDFMRKILM